MSPSAADLITYIGVPLTIIGLLPIAYNVVATLIYSRNIKGLYAATIYLPSCILPFSIVLSKSISPNTLFNHRSQLSHQQSKAELLAVVGPFYNGIDKRFGQKPKGHNLGTYYDNHKLKYDSGI